MNKASFVGTISLDFLDKFANNWTVGTTEDIIDAGLIKKPQYYLFTLGSGVDSLGTSLATTPPYRLPTHSQIYLAGRDVYRWGGTSDPYEVDFDRYGFTPDYTRGVTILWKAPKSEPHHLSELSQLLIHIPKDCKEICEAVFKGKRLDV